MLFVLVPKWILDYVYIRINIFHILGVGKTSLTYLIAHNKPLVSPGWTVGCSVEVKLHRFKEGTQAQNTFFVELWDVGGSNGHRITRNVFYQPTHGEYTTMQC